MQQRIERRYELTEDEVKLAVWRFLKEVHDRPLPEKPGDLDISFDHPDPFGITAEWVDKIQFTTKEESR